jgi:transcriptional regulator with XRE-family HTH domain
MARSTNALDGLRRRFGENLIHLRNRGNLSQEQTAVRAGLHKTELSLLERGLRLPRLDTIVKLAGAIEAEPCDLLTGMVWRAGHVRRGGYTQRGGWVQQDASTPKGVQPSESR